MNTLILEVLFVVVLATHHVVHCYDHIVTDKVGSIFTTAEEDNLGGLSSRLGMGPRFKRSLFPNLLPGLLDHRLGRPSHIHVNIPHRHMNDRKPMYTRRYLRPSRILAPVWEKLTKHFKPKYQKIRRYFKKLMPEHAKLIDGVPQFIPRISKLVFPPYNQYTPYISRVPNMYPTQKPKRRKVNIFVQPKLPNLTNMFTDLGHKLLEPISRIAENPKTEEHLSSIRVLLGNIYNVLNTAFGERPPDHSQLNDIPVETIPQETNLYDPNPGALLYTRVEDNHDISSNEITRNWLLEHLNRLPNEYVRQMITKPQIIDSIISSFEEHNIHDIRHQQADIEIMFFDSPINYHKFIEGLGTSNNLAPEFPENGDVILLSINYNGQVIERLWIRNKQSTDITNSHDDHVLNVTRTGQDILIPIEHGDQDLAFRIIGGKPATGSGSPIQSKGKRSLAYDDYEDENNASEDDSAGEDESPDEDENVSDENEE